MKRGSRNGAGTFALYLLAVIAGLWLLKGLTAQPASTATPATPVMAEHSAVRIRETGVLATPIQVHQLPRVETKEQFEVRMAASGAMSAKEIAEERARVKWYYDTSEDQMGRGEQSSAETTSLDTVNFGFPYSGEQHATLRLQKHLTYGRDVILKIERGQFMTSSSDYGQQRRIAVRFDDGPIQYFTLRPAADGRANLAFVSGYDRFVSKLRKAKSVTIEAPFFQEGTRVFEFDVHGLEWK